LYLAHEDLKMTIPVLLCNKCETHPATVKVVKIQPGGAKQLWLCSSCAAQESPYASGGLPHAGAPMKTLEDVLAGFFAKSTGGPEGAARPSEQSTELTCTDCGLPYEAYKTSLILGCAGCYKSFGEHLRADLRKFHGTTKHTGRVRVPITTPRGAVTNPKSLPDPQADQIGLIQAIDDLRRQINLAVEAEDYRRAAELKARITKLQEELDGLRASAKVETRESNSEQDAAEHGH
jgi:protein arginine kinase activator